MVTRRLVWGFVSHLFLCQAIYAANWYVNDTSTAGDAYTTAVGNDGSAGVASAPFRTIAKAMATVKSGDTVFVDAGLYAETVAIDTDNVALVGKDSATTVIDPPGTGTGIYADSQTGLLIKNIGLLEGLIDFRNVTQSTITSDSIFKGGIEVSGVSTSNLISNNVCTGSTILIYSSWNTITNNTMTGKGMGSSFSGIVLTAAGASNNLISNNTVEYYADNGIALEGCTGNVVSGNTARYNENCGIRLAGSSDNKILQNFIVSNFGAGICVGASSVYNIGRGSDSNIIAHNLIRATRWPGLETGTGGGLGATAVPGDAFAIGNANNSFFYQNDMDSNTAYQFTLAQGLPSFIWGSASMDTFQKNNIRTSLYWPDSGVFINTGKPFDFSRNWWGTTDEQRIDKMIADTSATKKITFKPFRLGLVDTTPGADTVAPKAPQNISITKNTSGQPVLSWTNPAADEENTVLTGFGGIRIYRIVNRTDTTDWAAGRVAQVGPTVTTWTDTSVTAGNNYYYRLTSFDTWPIVNESWFSDSILTTDTGNAAFAFIRRGASNPPPQSVFGAVSDLPVIQIVIGPKSNGTLSSIKVTAGGSGNDVTALSASGVKLWQDGDGNGTGDTQLGSSGTVTADNGSVTFSGLSVSLTKDKPMYLVVTYSFAGTATAGQTFVALVASASDITATASSGASFNFAGLPVAGEPVTAVSSLNTSPSAPSPSSPADAAVGFAPSGEITITGYSDADGDTHKCTHWQAADSTSIFDNMHMRVNVVIPAEMAGLRFKFPRGLLRGAQKHYWRARFCDARGGWSAWMTTRSFTTATETLAITPTAAKRLDTNPFARDTRPIGFKLKNGGDEKFTTLGGVKFEDEVSDTGRAEKPSTNFKFGLIAFTCEGVAIGGTITISLDMPESVPVTAKYFIFDAANGWLDMTSSLTSHDGDSEVFLTLTDGGTGDLDGVANGVVVDPGGFEISDGSSSGSSGGDDAAINYPAACLITRILQSQMARWAAACRTIRDRFLDSAPGRVFVSLYYEG